MLSPSDLELLISDYGLCSLKKFCKLFIQYNAVNAWSAPEIWSAENSATEPEMFENTKTDSYSFGMMLWEIETGQVPFEGYDDKSIRTLIVVEKMRPKIPEKTEKNLANLIRRCWHEKP
jgi:serine/threonine protein kinase